jgi:hypothetical protein
MMPVATLAALIDRKISSLRVAVAAPVTDFDWALRAAKLKLGGRIYFDTGRIAAAIAAEMALPAKPPRKKRRKKASA